MRVALARTRSCHKVFWHAPDDPELTCDGRPLDQSNDYSMCAGSAQWNPCETNGEFMGASWVDGDKLSTLDPPLTLDLTFASFSGSTQIAFYFAHRCSRPDRFLHWELRIDDETDARQQGTVTVTGNGRYLAFAVDFITPGTTISLVTQNTDPLENALLCGVFLSNRKPTEQ
ncbi:hypothetical protein ACFL6C_05640 [Myxococcota bacterium]